MTDSKSSAKLERVMKEIREILKREDIAGYVLLYEPGCSEFYIEAEPSWSILNIDDDGRVRFKIPVDPTLRKHNEQITRDMAVHFADNLHMNSHLCLQLVNLLNVYLEPTANNLPI